MKIRPKKGTKLEALLIEMNARLKREENEALDMVGAYCGTRPDTIGYSWIFGSTAIWSYRLIGFKDDAFVPAKLVRNKDYPENDPLYKVPKRGKEGRDFVKSWDEKFKGIDGSPLVEFGIPVLDEKTGRYSNWLPLKDQKGVYINVGSHLYDRMKLNGTTQFEIEINQ